MCTLIYIHPYIYIHTHTHTHTSVKVYLHRSLYSRIFILSYFREDADFSLVCEAPTANQDNPLTKKHPLPACLRPWMCKALTLRMSEPRSLSLITPQ